MLEEYYIFLKDFFNKTGLDLSQYKEDQVVRRLETYMRREKIYGFLELKDRIKDKEFAEEIKNYITINVTEFFRNRNLWDNLINNVLPELVEGKKSIKIWSAACSSGEEPYTISMIMKEYFPKVKFEVLATDLDGSILELAKKGEYHNSSIVTIPKDKLNKYFNLKDDKAIVKNVLSENITFKQHNLLKDIYPRNLDIIICRNVLIYFTEKAKNNIYENFNKSLKMSGVLFLGATEQIHNPNDIGFKNNSSFIYTKI